MEKYPKKRAYAKPKLRAFLVEKGVYEKFLINHKNDEYNKIHKGRFCDVLQSAFHWDKTPEGVEFWLNLAKELDEQT